MIGDIYNKKQLSAYAPSKEVADFTNIVKKDVSLGVEILNRGWTELNGRSIIDDMNRGQMMMNAFVDTSDEDPSEDWKWKGTRSVARNKGIAMHAQLTAAFIIPSFSAQNEADENDRDFANVMRDIIEWMTLPTNSDYQKSFLSVVFGMMESPVVYLGAEWFEVFQTIKTKTEEGKMTKEEILDEVLSGFNAPVYTADQVLITNAYERNIQKQRAVTLRAYKEYQELEAKYGDHENWQYVTPGVKSVYSDDDGLFYDIKDDDHPHLCEELIHRNRTEDSEVPFVNGIYLGDMDDVENNPIRHRDNRNAPKYPLVPFGYNRIGSHFFYYKSMMNIVGWDNDLYDAMSQLLMNRAFLEVEAPIAISGVEEVDTDIIFPSAVVAFADENAKVNSLLPPANMAAGFNALVATKESIDEATTPPTISGDLPPASQTALATAQATAEAKKLIKGVAQSLSESVVMYGELMADIALNHYTIAQVDEITAGGAQLKYRQFVLEDQLIDGKKMNKEIRFDEFLIGRDMSQEKIDERSLKLLEESGFPDIKSSIRVVNPHLFSKFRYLARIDPEEMFPKNSAQMSAVLSGLYAQVRQDPLVKADKLVSELMNANFPGRGEEFINDIDEIETEILPGEVEGSPLAQQVQQKQIAPAVQDAATQ